MEQEYGVREDLKGYEIRPLAKEFLYHWLQLHRSLYGRFPWPNPISEDDVISLIDSSESQSFVMFHNEQVTAIASLKDDDDEPEVKAFSDFVALDIPLPALEAFIRQIISQASGTDVKRIWTWMWNSETKLMDVLASVGFAEKGRHGLYSSIIKNQKPHLFPSNTAIRSIADGTTISDFVRANREAFKDDPSRPLEESELEGWLAKDAGWVADLQLAAIMDEEIVGTVMCEIITNPINSPNRHWAWIHGLGVVKQYRRQGIASHLINALLTKMRMRGIEKVWLFTDIEGPIRTFYEHVGFVKEVEWVEFELNTEE